MGTLHVYQGAHWHVGHTRPGPGAHMGLGRGEAHLARRHGGRGGAHKARGKLGMWGTLDQGHTGPVGTLARGAHWAMQGAY